MSLLLGLLLAADAPTPVNSPTPVEEKPGYVHVFGSAVVGSGLRFNNPYRLATPLGDTAESVSRTATYVDFGGGVTFGGSTKIQHGGALRITRSIEGVSQWVTTPSYVGYRRWSSWALFARGGIPLVLSPDRTWGLEGSAGGIWFARSGLGVTGELVGDVIYGAGVREKNVVTYPLVSLQIGIHFDYEVLP
jgi:hypothetical protein